MKYLKFSIIIPTYNRGKYLPTLFAHLAQLDYPHTHFEVLLVDNNSTDETTRIARAFHNSHPTLRFRYVHEKKQGRSFAMNKGITQASYPKIVSLDDDILFKKNLLREYNRLYQKYPRAAMIGGPIEILMSKGDVSQIKLAQNDRWMLGELSYSDKEKFLQYPDMLFAGNFSINYSYLRKQLFSLHLGIKRKNLYLYAEDMEFTWRLLLEGKKILYSTRLTVKNVIEAERVALKYWLKRIYAAGIERKITDRLLASYPSHQQYPVIKSVREKFKVIVHKATKDSWQDLAREIIFAAGYLSKIGPSR